MAPYAWCATGIGDAPCEFLALQEWTMGKAGPVAAGAHWIERSPNFRKDWKRPRRPTY